MKIKFKREQILEVELLRNPTEQELEEILKSKYFDLPNDLIDWETEEVIEEDYSNSYIYIELIKQK